jgi:hypothetical protein
MIPCSSGAGGPGVVSIPAHSDAHNVPSFRRWRFEMKLSPFFLEGVLLFSVGYFIELLVLLGKKGMSNSMTFLPNLASLQVIRRF